ncbi:MAG: radical SAM protein [Desulfobacterales bacterium]|nr:radical SAM protein [Desulfobacterales bacterium]
MPQDLAHANARLIDEDAVYRANLRLNKTEYALRRLRLQSMPRYLGIVIGNACNINCLHCYQLKTGDNLLRPREIGEELRRELTAFYPYLSTLRIQGGEVFVIKGFEELLDDISSIISRPVISISTNGTLIDEKWAERIVRTPFLSVTVSIDGATPETYAKLRRGADLRRVLQNVQRIQDWKSRLGSSLPHLDFFYLLMRSNFREIPRFLTITKDLGIKKITFQTILVDERNLTREPTLNEEVISDHEEVRELYDIIGKVVVEERKNFEMISISGLRTLFDENGLDTSFIKEESFSIYPENAGVDLNPNTISRDAAPGDPVEGEEETNDPGEHAAGAPGVCGEEASDPGERAPGGREDGVEGASDPGERDAGETGGETGGEISLCPNPWTLMFITESGDVQTCFLATPMGNLYETPLVRLWNSPRAISARSRMISGRYDEAECSGLWCSWREGKKPVALTDMNRGEMIHRFKEMVDRALVKPLHVDEPAEDHPSILGAIRRMLTERGRRIAELEWNLVDLCEKNKRMLEEADRQCQVLERELIDERRKTASLKTLLADSPGRDRSAHGPGANTLSRKILIQCAIILSRLLNSLKFRVDRLAMKIK